MKKNSQKNRLRLFALSFFPRVSAFLLAFLSIVLLGGALLIIGNAGRLGWAFWPLLLAYLGILATVVAVLYRRRERQELRALVGEEEFARMYPRIYRREQKRKQKMKGKRS